MMLNSVVLPDPLGPISPAIDPFGTDSEHSESACRPPNALEMPSASISALIALPPP